MQTGGYIKIPRDLFDGQEFGGEKFSRREAFIDLVQMAVFKPTIVYLPGNRVQLERGQIIASRRFLAARWGWSMGRVDRYIDEICNQGRCTKTNGRITILTITGYDCYNDEWREPRPQKPPEGDIAGAVNRLYALYPTKCPVSGRSTGKSSKDKHKLEILLRTFTEEKLGGIITRYIKECTEQNSYVKNFATFLNNIPDYDSKSDNTPRGKTKDEALQEAKNPTQDEINRQYNAFFIPQYPMGPGESQQDYQARTRPFWDRFYKAWIDRRIEAVNNKY